MTSTAPSTQKTCVSDHQDALSSTTTSAGVRRRRPKSRIETRAVVADRLLRPHEAHAGDLHQAAGAQRVQPLRARRALQHRVEDSLSGL